uniref:Uncharacterized protein n=1 Tax=Kalanchoe fedtschenkoi TaxID=63787 RepID=A0A7N0VJK3_KALFE
MWVSFLCEVMVAWAYCGGDLVSMGCKCVCKRFICRRLMGNVRIGALFMNLRYYECSGQNDEDEILPEEWYQKVFPKMERMSYKLRNVDVVDGRLVNLDDRSVIFDDDMMKKMSVFKSLARTFIGSATMLESLKRNVEVSASEVKPLDCFTMSSSRQHVVVDSLTKVCNSLNITAQQRKAIRLAVSPQVTQHRIWAGTLCKILSELKSELHCLNVVAPNSGTRMGQQILFNCLKFLDETASYNDPEATSWMRIAAPRNGAKPTPHTWEVVLEMFHDLVNCLRNEDKLQLHVKKLDVMKEGLNQIRDVIVDKTIPYKEALHQEHLVQKKLSKTLGQPSKCLFTLLLYYLFGNVRNIELDVSGGVYGTADKGKSCLCMGKVMTSDDERMISSGVKQLDRALRLYKFVWEMANSEPVLELQGHMWIVGAANRTLIYRGNMYFMHGISL